MNGKSNKRTIILALILVACVVVFVKMRSSSTPPDAGGKSLDEGLVEVETLLGKLSTVQVNNSFTSNNVFVSLKDINKPLPNLPIGRPNPFASTAFFSSKEAK